MAERTSKIVRTERVEVVDSDGRVRVVIGTIDAGTGMVGVTVLDSDGRERGFIVTDEGGAEAGVSALGNNLACIRATDDGDVTAFLADPKGNVLDWWDNAA